MPDLPAVISVAVVEDRRDLREALGLMIRGTPGFQCAGLYGAMEEALEAIPRERPEVALVDLGLPKMSGVEGIRELRRRCPAVIPLVLTVYEDDERIFEALCAGAGGYLLKRTPPAQLLEYIREAAGGGAPMTPEVARRVIALFRDIRPPRSAACDLTPHETRILKMLVDGENYKSAAKALGVSVATIAFHVQNIYRKLEVHSKSEAVSKALREGMVR